MKKKTMSKMEMADKIARISDVLEQIGKLNEMVAFHKEAKELSLLKQYQDMRNDFVKELELLLSDFNLNLNIEDIAA